MSGAYSVIVDPCFLCSWWVPATGRDYKLSPSSHKDCINGVLERDRNLPLSILQNAINEVQRTLHKHRSRACSLWESRNNYLLRHTVQRRSGKMKRGHQKVGTFERRQRVHMLKTFASMLQENINSLRTTSKATWRRNLNKHLIEYKFRKQAK